WHGPFESSPAMTGKPVWCRRSSSAAGVTRKVFAMDAKNLDIEFLVDKSGSMLTADCPGGKTRWAFSQETTLALATHCQKFDPDGITVATFARSFKVYEGTTAAKVSQIYRGNQPGSSTATAGVLKNRLDAY